MSNSFAALDWTIFAAYFLMIVAFGWFSSRQKTENSRDYFLGGNTMSYWVVAVSVLATSQSAATFLGGPDQGFRGDYTYLSANIGAIIAAIFVAKVLIPKYYALKATTVYEILEDQFNARTMRAAGGMYLIGRVFASGSRLYLAAIAVAMILFSNVDASSVILAAFIMMIIGFLMTFLGGINSVIWSDLIQFIIYIGSALAVLLFLRYAIPVSDEVLLEGLRNAPDAADGTKDKLRLIDFGLDFSQPFALLSILFGLTLLNIGSFGLDQDITQRVLACKNAKEGGRSILISAIVAIPVIWIFISIGQLLHVFYERPELMGADIVNGASTEFKGEKISIFMHYILNELPPGLRGLVTVGVVAAAVSTINSGLNSMSSVIVEDFYRPWRTKRKITADMHFVYAGRVSMALVGMALFLMASLCYFWQKYTNMPLLEFALSVMVFSYSGLLGVYFTVIFTRRGSPHSVLAALAIGFLVTLFQQSYIVDILHLPPAFKSLAFSWQLCIGTLIAFLVCIIGKDRKTDQAEV